MVAGRRRVYTDRMLKQLRRVHAWLGVLFAPSSLIGLSIAFTTRRDRTLHVVLLVAGVAVPVILLLMV